MQQALHKNKEWITGFAGSIYESFMRAPDRAQALAVIAEEASRWSRTDSTLPLLADHDEISLNFVELIDQIGFEMEESRGDGGGIRDYIVDDLYARVRIYLDLFKDPDLYRTNLRRRMLTHDDTVIIRQCRFAEFVPRLIEEYSDQTFMQKSILRATLAFDDDELLNFYYEVAKGDVCIDVLVLALVGLRKFGQRFSYWRLLRNGQEDMNRLIDYAEQFDLTDLERNPLPNSTATLLFVLSAVELVAIDQVPQAARWVLGVMTLAPRIGQESAANMNMLRLIVNIVLFCGHGFLQAVMHDVVLMKEFVRLLNGIPREFFDRISAKLTLAGKDFRSRLEELATAGSINPAEGDSNILSFLLWGKQQIF